MKNISSKNVVANTIVEQIGGEVLRKIVANSFVTMENGTKFMVDGSKFHGKVVITLNTMDTYDIEFWKINMRNLEFKKIDEINDIYNNQLAEVILWRVV